MAAAKKTTAKAAPEPKTDDRVAVKIPRAKKGEETFITASVNGKVYKIKKGETVMVPPSVAEVLNNVEDMIIKQEDYIESKQ